MHLKTRGLGKERKMSPGSFPYPHHLPSHPYCQSKMGLGQLARN